VLVGKLMCIEQSLIYRVIGRADQMLMTEVDQRLRLLFAM
jgi:hypothetical protein